MEVKTTSWARDLNQSGRKGRTKAAMRGRKSVPGRRAERRRLRDRITSAAFWEL